MKRLIVSLFVAALCLSAQVATLPNTDFPTFRANLNTSLQNAASISGAYVNPGFITSLSFTKLFNVPLFARTDQANTWTVGVQDFSAATHLRLPTAANYNPNVSGYIGYDTATNTYKGFVGTVKTFAFTDSNITGNAATATRLVANPTTCAAGSYPLGVDASGNAEGCTVASAGVGDMLTTDYIASGSGAPTGACPKRGKEYFDISVTPFDMYKCGADGGAWIGPFERYDDTKTGANYLRGLVSGGAGDIVVDAAGTPILYAKPVWNGIDDLTNKVLTDLGPFTCNTRATLSARLAGIVCHQQGWTTPATDGASATGTPSASFCLSTTGPCLKDAGGTLQAVTDAAGATPAPVLASSYTMPSGTPFKAFGMYQSPPPAGLPTFYFDASALLPQFNAADGTLAGTMVKPLADPGSSDHKVVRYIPGTGDPVRVQLGCADLSGVGTGCAGPLPLASSTTPLMDGAAAVGTGATFARPDHVHPSDTSRVPTTRTVNGHALSADVSVTTADLSLNNVTNDAQTKAAIVPNTAPAAGNLLVGNAGGTAYAPVSVSGSCTMDSAGVISCYKVWECQPGLGDGFNPIPTTGSPYLQTTCRNNTGGTVRVTGIQCFSDNNGTSTLLVTNGAGTHLLASPTDPLPCSSTYAAGTQSATVDLASGDYIKFSFTSDGTTKQTTWNIVGSRP